MTQIRNLFTFNSVLHAVRDDDLISIDSAGDDTVLTTIGSAGGPVEMEQNLTQLVISDAAQIYVWDGTTLTTEDAYAVGQSLCFIDQRIVFPERDTQSFRWTALGDARTIDPLDFASAEGSPDKLIAVVANMRELLALGEQTSEVWHSLGAEPYFERSSSEYLQVGCAAPRSAIVVGDTPIWLGRDKDGQAQVMAGRGQRISTRAQEEQFEGLDLSSARAFTFNYGAFRLYCLNVPNVETTLVFDLNFKQWVEFAELVDGDFAKWRPTCHAFAYGRHFFGADDGIVYRLNEDEHTYAGDPKCRERICPVISAPSRKRLRFPSAEMVCEKATTGTVQLRYSDDNGNTWSNWRYETAGAVGELATQVNWNRLGSAFDRVYQVRMTDDAPWNPVAFEAEVTSA